MNRAAMRTNWNYVWQLTLRRKVAGDVRIVRSVIADVGEPLMGVKMLRLRPFWIGASPRVGRASRSEMNPLTGSVGIIPNLHAVRKGANFVGRISDFYKSTVGAEHRAARNCGAHTC